MKQKVKKVVLAYSGGLDTSIIIPWLKENYGCEVVAMAGNSQLVYLVIQGNPIPINVAPNTKINLGFAVVTLNQQFITANTVVVRAVDIKINTASFGLPADPSICSEIGVPLRLPHLFGIAIAPNTALAQQPVRRQPGARQYERRPPREARQYHRRGQPADHLHRSRGDEVHRDPDRRPRYSLIEFPRHRKIAGELRILEVPHARRPDARGRQPVVEPRGGAAPEILSYRLLDWRQHLQQDEARANDNQRHR